VFDLAASDDRLDSAFPDEPAVLVVVVAAVGDQRPRPANAAADMWYAVEQLEQLGDVVAVELIVNCASVGRVWGLP
jgi:hypothetical protein